MDQTDHSILQKYSELTIPPVQETMQKIREAIWQRRPILGEIMKKHGSQTLYDYARDFLDVNRSPRLNARKNELIATTQELLTERLGSAVAEEVAMQLSALPLVSTADHHAPIQHPFWINANIISALPYQATENSLLKYLVVFSFASVSLNNASGFSRGLMVRGAAEDPTILKLPILPDKEKMGIVYGMRPYTADEIIKTKTLIDKKEREGTVIPHERAVAIKAMIDRYYASEAVLNAKDLSEQITRINYAMWPNFFSGNVPDLIYLDIETLVTELLLRYHLDDPNSLLYKLLFDETYQVACKAAFNNIPGAFSFEHDSGTHLFWAIDDKHHRVRMFQNEGQLHSTYRRHTCPMTPDGIRAALVQKEIFPSMLLCYLVVSLYYGMKCLGGFCQVNDLTMTKTAWQKLLREVGENEEAAAVDPMQTKELGGDGMVLAYLRGAKNNIHAACGMDLLLAEKPASFNEYLELSKRVTLSEMMEPMLPEMYTVLYAAYERDPLLSALAPEHILKQTDLKNKIKTVEVQEVLVKEFGSVHP